MSKADQNQSSQGFQGYSLPISGTENPELTHIERGTRCGEYLRRYWHPVAMSSELGELPMNVEILAEELVLFRDKSGRLGLLHRHCSHRGASLEYGIVAEQGIICCYHGWHYDIDGRLLCAGSEPADGPLCQQITHGAYPTHEHNGIIFAYLGPADEKPEFPVFDTELIGDIEAIPFSITTPCNWLQVYENTQDPIHVLHLHSRSSGVQFGVASGVDQETDYKTTPIGMINVQSRRVGDNLWVRSTESILPNVNQTGAIFEEADEEKYFQRSAILRWMVPVNNVVTRTIGWRFFSQSMDPNNLGDRGQVGKEKIDFIGQTEEERPYEERQRQPGDYEAQVSQRQIAVHGLEHHGTSDAGVVRIRHLLRRAMRELESSGKCYAYTVGADQAIATYIQDSVTPWPTDDSGLTEQEKLRIYGKLVSDAVLNSAELNATQRQGHIREVCKNIQSSE
ncbi:MAG: phenylpropionate dioxygenase-like ring-hydroxylating dioxygenase large terminal subunit [Parasphingorhabdus sp.]|jgi:phenylpropionate dioxygenase-like ring-hydroxylating dioxygenase large terminal subunit